ncbi:hypothetical protein TrST_g1415 [Triparma strigata]|uniref:Uncharacterized protein n=1 Tax=Triparma strigata TaxID=1606541 RepID=A0A9W7F0A9_9STRA|nr:hypothetical protein TrST_g1415 [Triparma strigata]
MHDEMEKMGRAEMRGGVREGEREEEMHGTSEAEQQLREEVEVLRVSKQLLREEVEALKTSDKRAREEVETLKEKLAASEAEIKMLKTLSRKFTNDGLRKAVEEYCADE